MNTCEHVWYGMSSLGSTRYSNCKKCSATLVETDGIEDRILFRNKTRGKTLDDNPNYQISTSINNI